MELTAVLAAVRPLLGGALGRGEGLSALEVGLVGAAEVGGAAPEFRHDGCDGVQSGAGSATGGDVLADFEGGLEVVDGLVEAFRKLAGLDAVVQGSLVRVGLAPCVVLLVPFLVGFETALGDLAGVGEGLFVNVEGLLRVVAEELLEAGDGLGAQLGAVGGRVVGLARGRPCDQGVDLDELRLVRGGGAGLGDGVGQAFDVLLVGAVRWMKLNSSVYQPYAWKRLSTSSASTRLVSPSIWMRLASKITVRLPSCWLAARRRLRRRCPLRYRLHRR